QSTSPSRLVWYQRRRRSFPRDTNLTRRSAIVDSARPFNRTSTEGGISMNANLLSLAQSALGGDFSKLAGSFLGESPTATQGALSSLLPAVLGTIAHTGSNSRVASSQMW